LFFPKILQGAAIASLFFTLDRIQSELGRLCKARLLKSPVLGERRVGTPMSALLLEDRRQSAPLLYGLSARHHQENGKLGKASARVRSVDRIERQLLEQARRGGQGKRSYRKQ